MAHRRKPVATALFLNSLVTVVEIGGGMASNSLSLVVDGIHNVSDEAALLMLLLAYTLATGVSRRFVLAANLFNSIGLGIVTAYMVLQALHRINTPTPVLGLVPVIAGIIGAVGNWGVARVLRVTQGGCGDPLVLRSQSRGYSALIGAGSCRNASAHLRSLDLRSNSRDSDRVLYSDDHNQLARWRASGVNVARKYSLRTSGRESRS